MALKGIKVLEFSGLAPAPFCGMILADFGATVIRIDKAKGGYEQAVDCLGNGKTSVGIDIKQPEGAEIVKRLSRTADVLIEPFRAGVMEKLGLGPKELMAENKRLIYARLTGYGQRGPLAHKAGHDINFLSYSGVLSMLNWEGARPTPPLNLAADFGGGGLLCALGIAMALFERSNSGLGQVVDSSMTQGSAYLASWLFRSRNLPIWGETPGSGMLDGGSERYGTYETLDGKWMAVGALEEQFYEKLILGLGLTKEELETAEEPKELFKSKFKTKTRDEWTKIFSDLDACVSPVLGSDESLTSFVEGTVAPTPSPHLERTPASSLAHLPLPNPSHEPLLQAGYSREQLEDLARRGIIAQIRDSKL